MSYAERHTVSVTTDASGDATDYSPVITGRIVSIAYAKTDFEDTADFTITAEATTQGLWTEANVTASKTVAPMQPAYSQAGAALLYASGGTAVTVPIFVASDRVKIVVASGGDTKTGTFTVTVA